MKLYGSTTSPFVRLVRLVARHHGLDGEIEFVPIDTMKDREALQARNPLGKIPVLETGEGEFVFDSPVICDYLDNLGDGESLFITEAVSPWQVRTLLALSNGTLDAFVNRAMMQFRTPDPADQSQWWLARWRENGLSGIAAMAACLDEVKESGSIAEISFPVAMDYIDFRNPDLGWRGDHPAFAEWIDAQLASDFFVSTTPNG